MALWVALAQTGHVPARVVQQTVAVPQIQEHAVGVIKVSHLSIVAC